MATVYTIPVWPLQAEVAPEIANGVPGIFPVFVSVVLADRVHPLAAVTTTL